MKKDIRSEIKNNRTELIFILDRSGSMYGLEEDTVGGFNMMIDKQKEVEGDVKVTTVLFNHEIKYIHDRFDISEVSRMSAKQFTVGGSTALLDAIGSAVQKEINVQSHLPAEARAGKVIFVIITDGYENSSSEYSYKHIRKMIEHEQKKYGWEFMFLGANIDAVSEGAKFGIRADRAVRYKSDSVGTALNYACVSEAITGMRCMTEGAEMDGSWKEAIIEDVAKRGV